MKEEMMNEIRKVEKVVLLKMIAESATVIIASLIFNICWIGAVYGFWYYKTSLDILYLVAWWIIFGWGILGLILSITWDILKRIHREAKYTIMRKVRHIKRYYENLDREFVVFELEE
jgi:hypothetical protein